MARARKNGEEEDETEREDDDENGDDDDEAGPEDEEKAPRAVRGHPFAKQGRRSSRDSGRAAFKLLDLDVANPLSRSEAAKRLGVRPGTLFKWQRDERITGVQDEHGTWWFDPVAVEALRTEQQGEDFTSAQLLDAARGIIKQEQGHNEAMARNVTNFMEQAGKRDAAMMEQAGKRDAAMMGAFLSTIKELQELQMALTVKSHERADRAEAELEAARAAIDAAMTSQVQREQMVADAEAARARSDAGMRQLMTFAPMVASLLTKRLGGPSVAVVDPALKELVTSMKPEQLKALLESGILTQDQLAQFAFIWQQVKDSEAQPAGGDPPHPGPPEAKG